MGFVLTGLGLGAALVVTVLLPPAGAAAGASIGFTPQYGGGMVMATFAI